MTSRPPVEARRMHRPVLALSIFAATSGLAKPSACEATPWLFRVLHRAPTTVDDHWIRAAHHERWRTLSDIRGWVKSQYSHFPPDGDCETVDLLSLGLAVIKQQPDDRENAKLLYGLGRDWLSEKDPYIRGVGIRMLKFISLRYPNSPSAFYSSALLASTHGGVGPAPREKVRDRGVRSGPTWQSLSDCCRYWSVSVVPNQK